MKYHVRWKSQYIQAVHISIGQINRHRVNCNIGIVNCLVYLRLVYFLIYVIFIHTYACVSGVWTILNIVWPARPVFPLTFTC